MTIIDTAKGFVLTMLAIINGEVVRAKYQVQRWSTRKATPSS